MKHLIFKSSFHEKLKFLIIPMMLLTLGVGQMWGWNNVYYQGDNTSWNNVDMGNSGDASIYMYIANGQYWRYRIENCDCGPDSNTDMGIGSGSGKWYRYDNCASRACGHYTGYSGIVLFHAKQEGNGDRSPWVWLERPTVVIKHDFTPGGSWEQKNMTDNNNGTYKYTGNYGGTGANIGPSSWLKYIASPTLVGSPASGDRCIFEYNASGYQGSGNEDVNTGSLTITKLCGLTYNGNGRTGGTAVPSALSDQKYGTTITLSSAAMTKTGYTLTGWNTANDGSGTHYDLGDSFTFSSKSNTLYAEWTQTITVDKNTGTSAGSMSICFNAGSLKSFTAATKTDWILDSYWTTADESGSKVIEYDASTGTASLVSSLSDYITTGKWTRASATTLWAHWKQTYRVTYNANYPSAATSKTGSVPTDATEYASGATVTVKSNSGSLAAGGYTFAGWQTEPTGGTSYAAGSGTFSISEPTTLYAKWTENMRSVTISVSPSGAGTLNKTSASVGVATTTTVTATANPGYRFTGWTATNCSVASTSSASTTLSGNGTTGDATLVANFARTYAYLEGRMTVYDAARSTETHVGSSKGKWSESSFNIAMDYDATNHRFYRHTYKTPAELSATQTDRTAQSQWFSIARSNASGSWSGKTTYHPSSNTDLTTAGIAQKKAAQTSTTSYNYKFNSSTTNGYAILYFDESGVWYTLEHSLAYDGNGKTSGTVPATVYYDNGTNATAASNPFTKTNYTFGGWNTAQYITGTSYAAGASVPMNANTTLYAKWTRSVTLNRNTATTGSTSVTATYNCATLPSITAPEKTGYTFGGWYTANDGSGSQVINTSGALQSEVSNWTTSTRFTRTASDATLYAKWTQTITLNYNSANHGSGSNKSATVILNKTALSSITHCTPATGYHRVGYYTDATGGTKVLNADGSFASSAVTDYITDGKWTKAGATTLYAQYEANTYTIAFNANDAQYVGTATGTTASIAATYGQSYALTANGFTREGYTFDRWTSNADGTGTSYTDGQTVSNLTNENNGTKTLYAKWTGKTYTVTFNPKGGTNLNHHDATVTMGALYTAGTGLGGTLPTVTPPAGYVFDGWYTAATGGTKITASSKVAIPSDHTLYAHYTTKAQVYFKNTLGWSKVYVTYGSEWDGNQGAGNKYKTYHKMQLVPGTTDVYYDDIPDDILTSWQWNVAFDNTGFCADEYKDNPTTGTYYSFNKGEAVFRFDFDRKSTMFVPTSNTGSTADGNYQKNGVQYRSTGYPPETGSNPEYFSGYWRTYNNTYSGYTMTYQKRDDPWSSGHKMECAQVGDNTFIYTVHMDANSQYNFAFYKERHLNNKSEQFCYDHYTQINSENCTNLKLDCNPNNSYMQTTVAGDYTFKLEMKNDGHMYLSVIYPLAVGDFRVRYNYTKGSAKTYYSEIIKGRANGKDTISIFIHSKDSASSRSLTVEKCTGISSGTPTWNTSYLTVTSKLPAATTAGGKTSGVYDFIITQNGSKEIILDNFSYWKQYTGNYYIRTQCADGGWDLYKYRTDNIMTLSEYSLTQTLSPPYSHYYCRFIESTSTDITYCIATDYSPNISGILVGDATIGGNSVKTLPASANVRFTWNEETNAMFRAYLKNAQNENERFLVLHGSDNKVLDASGNTIPAAGNLNANELLFTDLGNWIYQVNLQAQPGAKVSLIANYNNADRYLIGGASSFLTIIDGEGSAKYEMITVYDFKTNRLMTAWTPSGEVSANLTDVDVLLIRYKQDAGTAITLATGKTIGNQDHPVTVIGAIRFDYNDMVGHVANWTNSSRPLLKYFISFPFNVKVSDLFGLNSAYGDAYVIQKYAGDERAQKGFFRGDGTTTFWKDLKAGDVMKANEGYCVILDNDYFNGDVGDVWQYKSAGSSVYLYFPSAETVGEIATTSKTITVPEHKCTIDRTFTSKQAGGRTVNHKNTDSNWNMMGVPIFNTHSDNGTAGQPGAVFADSGQDGDGHFNYYYQWGVDNSFTIHTAKNEQFKSMHGYMVQYHGDVTFKTAAAPASVAARKAPMEDNYQLELQVRDNNDEILNRAYVELRENACDTFALNEDVYMSFNNRAVNVYTLAGSYDVAANVLSVGNHTIPVCVEVTKAGQYTFSMPSNFSGEVTLVDLFNNERINLSTDDYEVDLTKGVTEDRFLLELNINKVVTSIDGINGEGTLKDGKAHKFLQNGILYILQNGVLYDARGARVQ